MTFLQPQPEGSNVLEISKKYPKYLLKLSTIYRKYVLK